MYAVFAILFYFILFFGLDNTNQNIFLFRHQVWTHCLIH